MRKVLATMAAAVILAALGCSTTQPTTGGRQVISITTEAFVLVDVWWIWDVWADTDQDGVPETPTAIADRCVESGLSPVGAPVAWPYSAEVVLIQAGTTNEIPLASTTNSPNPFSNITPYDTSIRRTLPNDPPDVQGDIFWGVNGREVTAATRDYIDNCTNLGAAFASTNILGHPEAFSFEVAQGDTIVFRARKQLDANANPYAQIVRAPPTSLISRYFVDGRAVTPEGTVDTSSDGGGFTASVRIR